MNFQKYLAISLFLFTSQFSIAKDGIFFSDKPPIITRLDLERIAIGFTNTSDEILHGITIHYEDGGEKKSAVIIDTIKPHITVYKKIEPTFPYRKYSNGTITCVNFSSPIKFKQWD